MSLNEEEINLILKKPSLSSLSLDHVPLTQESLSEICRNQNLMTFEVVACGLKSITREDFKAMSNRPRITTFRTDLTFNKDDLHLLETRSEMVILDLLNIDLNDSDLESIGKIRSCHSMNLKGREITAAGIAHLKMMSSLKDLTLQEIIITEELAKQLNTNFNMLGSIRLKLSRISLDQSQAEMLTGLISGSGLILDNADLDDAAWEAFGAKQTFPILTLSNLNLSPAALESLSQGTNTSLYRFIHVPLTEEHIPAIRKLANKTIVMLSGIEITEELKQALQKPGTRFPIKIQD
ncbi:MAG: hypothetical protein R3C11_18880 [Planctomycetaceae bacterium]